MKLVGITGGIGSGKTYICKAFEHLGIPVFYADDEVKKMYDDTPQVHRKLVETFGDKIYNGNILNRMLLAQMVFEDAEALKMLNNIAHPAVEKRFLKWAKSQKNVPYVLQEAALLFESEAHYALHKTINVTASEELRIARAMHRDSCTRTAIINRMTHQLSDEARNALADYTIVNDNFTPILPQVLKIHEEICTL